MSLLDKVKHALITEDPVPVSPTVQSVRPIAQPVMSAWMPPSATSINLGVTSFTGRHVENRLYSSFGGGLRVHLSKSYGVWVQEIVNKIATVPWYTTTSIAFVRSW